MVVPAPATLNGGANKRRNNRRNTQKRNNPKGKRLTLVGKTNVLTFGHDLIWRTFQEIADDYPDVRQS